ncbi:hypothetical protein [Tsukamurella sp. 1534]|uniref:MutS-related protein n=1 Tax=Tsukamurella sp. 1534 TaxID=1151061 RepID=UPI0003175D44|nr:hypothetical protein [Tsukamurella sp. 1534]
MGFSSLLGEPSTSPVPTDGAGRFPAPFADLGLDRLVAAVSREDPEIVPLFHAPASSPAAARYRQDLCRALRGDPRLTGRLRRFCATMAEMREARANAARLTLRPESDAWALHAARRYLAAIAGLRSALAETVAPATALRDLREHLDRLAGSPGHRALEGDAAAAAELLDRVEYTVRIKNSDVRVGRYHGEPDYGAEVAAVFDRFRVDEGGRRAEEPPVRPGLDGIDAAILDHVTALFPEAFRALARFRTEHAEDRDPVPAQVDLEIRWYLAYLDFVAAMEAAGLPFTLPTIAERPILHVQNTFDVAMAMDLARRGERVVGNDLLLGDDERVLVLTGPNHGGKTALARAFGQVHHLAALGLPIPGTDAEIGLFDALYTRFERPESADDRLGRLEEDIEGMRGILTTATDRSVVVMNETFSSTSLEDGIRLGTAVVRRLLETGSRCVYVTFVDEIATIGPGVVSMTADVPDDPSERTYRVRRGPPRGLAHADALARRHGLDPATLSRRIAS